MNASETSYSVSRKEIRIESGPVDVEEQSESVSINANMSNLEAEDHRIVSSNCTPSHKDSEPDPLKISSD